MDTFELNLNNVLVDTFNAILKYEEVSLKRVLKMPVTITEAHIIEAIGRQENKESTVSEIAAAMGIAVPTATVSVKKLEGKGYVKKVPCARDGRRTIISLTDVGRKIERVHRLFHQNMVKNISSQFLDTEREVLLRAVKTLNEFFRVRVEA